MPLTEDPPQEDVDQQKESWDFEKFIGFYNQIADKNGGWHYEKNQGTNDLESFYNSGSYQSLKDYAQVRFEYEQRT